MLLYNVLYYRIVSGKITSHRHAGGDSAILLPDPESLREDEAACCDCVNGAPETIWLTRAGKVPEPAWCLADRDAVFRERDRAERAWKVARDGDTHLLRRRILGSGHTEEIVVLPGLEKEPRIAAAMHQGVSQAALVALVADVLSDVR